MRARIKAFTVGACVVALSLLTGVGLILGAPAISEHLPPARSDQTMATPQSAGQRVPVMVELFTSEGCSSCPPADQLLQAFHANQPVDGAQVIVLCEHVDSWNRLGWRDPFSSPQISARQERYARHFGLRSQYTPQMVVDGSSEFVGSSRTIAIQAITNAAGRAHAQLSLVLVSRAHQADAFLLTIDLGLTCPAGFEKTNAQLVAVLAQGFAEVSVPRGENEGRRLSHASVARGWQELAQIPASECNYSGRHQLRFETAAPFGAGQPVWDLVIFAQQTADLRVIGSERLVLNP